MSCTVPLGIELTDIITPKSCSSFIAELIKYVAFTKQQIPYPYERLKMYVLKRRERQKLYRDKSSSSEEIHHASSRVEILMEKYYKKVEEAFDILDTTFKCIELELMNAAESPVEEVVILFGATPVSPKDVYRFKIPPLCRGHSDAEHLMKRQLANLFRNIILSDEVNVNLQRRVGLTNMFVMLKVKKGRDFDSKWLLPRDQYKLSEKVKQVCFTFKTLAYKPCSCQVIDSQFEILSQSMAALTVSESGVLLQEKACESDGLELTEQFVWFQTPRSLKGFKDCKTQGRSITDVWYQHKFI